MTISRVAILFALSIGLGVRPGVAHALDDPSSRALSETLRSLGKGGSGKKAPPLDPRLAPLEQSPESMEELYAVAGAVLEELAREYDGDPEKMSQALERGKTDPEGFAKGLSPATRKRLEKLAGTLPPQ